MAGASRFRLFAGQALAEARILSLDARKKVADEIAAEARAYAPVLTGEYRDGIAVRVDGSNVSVVDTDPDSIWKEYGTSKMSGHSVITDAARSRGRYRGWRAR